MPDIPIKNWHIAVIVLAYLAAAVIVGQLITTTFLMLFVGIAGAFALHMFTGIGGASKLMGACFLWLGFSEQFFFFLCAVALSMGVVAVAMMLFARIFDREPQGGVPVAPFAAVFMCVFFPQTELASRLFAAIGPVIS